MTSTMSFARILRAIRRKLDLDSESMDLFVTLMEELVSSIGPSGTNKPILGIAQVLKGLPYELYHLNPLFYPARLEFDVRHSHVPFVVLQRLDISRIHALTSSHGLRFGFENISSFRLRDLLISQSPRSEYDYLHSSAIPPIFMGCLAQLAHDLLAKSDTSKDERGTLLKFLRGPVGRVPPSYILYDVENQTRFRETALSDLNKGIRNNKAVVIKYPRGLRDKYTNKEIVREIILIHQLKHPNIVSPLGVNFLTQKDGEQDSIGLVTMYMPHGNVMNFLSTHPTTNRMTIVWQVSNGLEYLHNGFDFPIAHRDIKGENILVERVDNRLVCRLIDFGLSSLPALSRQSRLDKAVGTTMYLAPEIGAGTSVDLLKADVFSLGNTFIEIFTGSPVLFFHLPRLLGRLKAVELKILSPPPEFFWEIVNQMMSNNPNERPSIKMVRQAIEDNFDPPENIVITENTGAPLSMLEEPEILPDFTGVRDIAREWAVKQKGRLARNTLSRQTQIANQLPPPLLATEFFSSTSRQQYPNHLHLRHKDLMQIIYRRPSPAHSELGMRNGLATPVTPTMRRAIPPSPAMSTMKLQKEDQECSSTPTPVDRPWGRTLHQPRPSAPPRPFLISIPNCTLSSGSESNDSLHSPVPKSPLSPKPLSPLCFKRDIHLSFGESNDFNGQENIVPTINDDGGSTYHKRRRTTQEHLNPSYSSASSSRSSSQLNSLASSH